MTKRMRWILSPVLVLGLLGAAAQGQQPQAQGPQGQDRQKPAGSSAGMSARCQEMMGRHEKMRGQMKAADQRLDELVARMNAASGQAKVDAVAATVTEMVAQRKTMREQMMQRHQQMLSHMGEHLQAGPQSMAACPMMKMGGMQH